MTVRRDYKALGDLFAMARYAGADIDECLLIVFEADDGRRHKTAAGFAKAHTILRRIGKACTLEAKRKAAALYPIVAEVAAAHGVAIERLMGPTRDREISLVREEAMWLCRRKTQASYPVIAAAAGCVNHTSAIEAVRRFEARLAADPELRARVLGEQRERRAA